MTTRLNIAMVAACPFPFPRGTPIRIHRMAEALAHRGHTVHVVTYHLGEPLADPPFHIHRTPRVPTYRKSSPGPSPQKLVVMDPLLTWRLRRLLRTHSIDVIHAHHYEGLLAGLVGAGRAGPPVVYDAHTALESELGDYLPGPLRRLAAKFGTWVDVVLPRKAAHVIVLTEALRQRLLDTHAATPETVTLVGNGVEQAHFEIPAGRRIADRSPDTLIFTGNLAPYQGIDLMLRAFRMVLDVRPTARLLIVTDSPFAHYESLAAELEVNHAIEVVGATFDQLPELLARATVALNPRVRCHGTPMKLLNYLAAAKPIVSFEGSAHGLQHRRTAWLVPGDDVAAFASGIVTLLDQPDVARDLAANAREFSRANLSWDHTARQVELVYEQVLRSGMPNRRPPSARPRPIETS